MKAVGVAWRASRQGRGYRSADIQIFCRLLAGEEAFVGHQDGTSCVIEIFDWVPSGHLPSAPNLVVVGEGRLYLTGGRS